MILKACPRISVLTVLLAAVALAPAWGDESAPARKDGEVTASDGAKIHYVEAGQGSSLVLIPGWTLSAEIWEPQIAHFSKSHRVVAFDPRGQGQSSKPAEGSFPATRARDIASVLDQLHLAPATLVCWSMAVAECVTYVDLFGTDKISGLVLVDGFAGDALDPEKAVGLLRFIGQFQKDRRSATDGFIRSMYKKPQSEDYLKRMIADSLETPTDTAVALFIGTLNQDNSKSLAKIDRPTLITVTKSPFTDNYKKMSEAIRGSKLEVFEAGHALFVDDADRFNKVLEDFLGTLGSP